MAEIASQKWGGSNIVNDKNLAQQDQPSPSSISAEPMATTTSDVTSSISSSSREDSSSSYKESSANSSDHESSSHITYPVLPPTATITTASRGNVEDNIKDIFFSTAHSKCATLPNRRSSASKKNIVISSTMLKKVCLVTVDYIYIYIYFKQRI